MTRNQAPNRYGYGCCTPCPPGSQVYIPDRVPECEPELCPDGTPSMCHCQLDDFLKMFPQYRCFGEDIACAVLNQAECFVKGMLVRCQREQATLLIAAHIMETSAIATTESSSRLAAVASGAMLSRPTSTTGVDGWLSLSAWGVMASALIELNPRVGVIAVG